MMDSFAGRIAVVTGGGTGMGRELVRQLAAEGCSVATCDVSADALGETAALARDAAPTGTNVETFIADVSKESDLVAFRAAVERELATDHVHLVFNNAGIAGGGSFVLDDREQWEKVFNVDFFGVYYSTRTFLPMLMAADEGHLVNTSSVNGLWASIGPNSPHTSYSAAKFAVRGFTEALMCDFRLNAPHLRASVVMPGHIGTSIVLNSAAAHGQDAEHLTAEDLVRARVQLAAFGTPVDGVSDEDLRKGMQAFGELFRDAAPMTAAEAATVILDGVRAQRWRILVGQDAKDLDEMVRADPEGAYDPAFFEALAAKGHFGGFGV
jgi:NAD(P)-dependent dehydrogenase (short-subunit alcohol dehydrogenase family)